MKIESGGTTQWLRNSERTKIESISVFKLPGNSRNFELVIRTNKDSKGVCGDSVSYLTVDELLDLKEEINNALSQLLN